MEVILLERIERLGQIGDVVSVKPGYARNYLLPQHKAMRATKANLEIFESQRAQIEATNLKRREEAEAVAAKMEGLRLVIVRQAAETGQLYGSVTARDIRDAAKDAGFTVEKTAAHLHQPIKALGTYGVPFLLHPEVKVEVSVTVARSLEEAERAQKAEAETAEEDVAEVEGEIEAPAAEETAE
ncbi:50S ribosomal protein L9 [uncultured Alphaproteobacteria bacterium]|uniref:Large ribosomal subunit protein bL9 n=1 Tax=uncultured Alphaproteobacteria bacterium TaxID=91750 RepID=A0A212KL72_9PROT|nr:50S ribosomal protein L9 [uncultured Alphaproteobacteria bacterium]